MDTLSMIYHLKKYELAIEVPESAPPFFKTLIENGEWEQYECEIIQKAIRGHRVLEGGAGMGVTTILIDRQAEYIISFEANPEVAAVAKRNQKRNKSSAKVVNAALGTKDGSVYFNFSPDVWDSRIINRKNTSKKVKVVDAQRVIDENKINALVLDVEGEEEKILDNIDLSPIKLMIIELHSHIDQESVTKKLAQAGFVRRNYQAKSDHSVVWVERKTKLLNRLSNRLFR